MIAGSVLVRRANNQKLELRLFNFQLASGERISDTLHISQLSAESWAAYQAPEVREGPSSRSPVSDVFGLGAVAYLILTGEAPLDIEANHLTLFDFSLAEAPDRDLGVGTAAYRDRFCASAAPGTTRPIAAALRSPCTR